MKTLKMVALIAILVSVSCKKDKNAEATNALVGHWHILNFVPDGSSDTDLLAKAVIDELAQKECFPLEYSFTSNGKVSSIDKMSFLDAAMGDDGVEVDCYFEDVFKDGTFSINNNVLTLDYGSETDVVNTIIGDDTLTVLNGSFILNEVRVSGKLIFSREVF